MAELKNDIVTPHQSPLIDSFDRSISYLRLSVTDRCDFRCQYCMAEDMTFLPRSQVLNLDEPDLELSFVLSIKLSNLFVILKY